MFGKMIEINYDNVEELIFHDNAVQRLLPEFDHLFKQWKIGKRVPALRATAQYAVISLLSNIRAENVEVLKTYFKTDVSIKKLTAAIVKNTIVDVDVEDFDAEEEFVGIAVSRDEGQLYLSLWR